MEAEKNNKTKRPEKYYENARKYGDKSHVGLETKYCVVCLEEYETGNLLVETHFDRRTDAHGKRGLRQTLPRYAPTGIGGLCPDCEKKKAEGCVFLVEAVMENGRPRPTGNHAAIRAAAWENMFSVPVPDNDESMAFIDPETMAKLREMAERGEQKPEPESKPE